MWILRHSKSQQGDFEETGLHAEAIGCSPFLTKENTTTRRAWYVYKFFILCRVTGGDIVASTTETSGVSWVKFDVLPDLDLSVNRTTYSQIN